MTMEKKQPFENVYPIYPIKHGVFFDCHVSFRGCMPLMFPRFSCFFLHGMRSWPFLKAPESASSAVL